MCDRDEGVKVREREREIKGVRQRVRGGEKAGVVVGSAVVSRPLRARSNYFKSHDGARVYLIRGARRAALHSPRPQRSARSAGAAARGAVYIRRR